MKNIKNIPENVDDFELEAMLHDYMHMTHDAKQKIKIGFRSWKKVEDIHDKIALECREKPYHVRIPQNSKFANLRKLLPKDYKWIRTGKRLQMEGIEMGHCVNSYWEDINNDICAIYSCAVEGKRYTIEFRQNEKGKYYIQQIQSRYNRGCPQNVKQLIQNYIK